MEVGGGMGEERRGGGVSYQLLLMRERRDKMEERERTSVTVQMKHERRDESCSDQ